jgi:hypothetical protein
MSTSKDNFLSRISSFEKIVSPDSIVDSVLISRALTDVEHNEKVKMLRNGMAIIGFTILEDFIKTRTGEILKEIGSTTVSFSSLPPKIKEAATISALKGIQTRADILKRNSEDHLTFIQKETWCVSSTKDAVYELSEFSLGWDKSNISAEDVKNFLGIFGVKSGWDVIQQISSSISITLPQPRDIFHNAAMRRHRAAHNAAADSLLPDLQEFVTHAKVIAMAFDSLLSRSLKFIDSNDADFLSGKKNTEFSHLKFRFVLEKDGKWKEFRQGAKRAVKADNELGVVQRAALFRSKNNGEILIIKSASNKLIDWFIN